MASNLSLDSRHINPFSSDCGLKGSLRLEIAREGTLATEELSLQQPFALIGRDRCADVCLSDDQVSRRHAYLQVIGGDVFCIDLQSRTGVWWGAARRQSGWLPCGGEIGVGPFRIRLLTGGRSDTALPERPDPTAPGPPGEEPFPDVVLDVLDRAQLLTRWRMDRVLVLIGRAPSCTFLLDDLSVSRYHLSVVATPGGIWAVDLLGKNGLRHGRGSVTHAAIRDGDELRVGRFRIRVCTGSSSVPAVRVGPAGTMLPGSPSSSLSAANGTGHANSLRVESLLVALIAQHGQVQRHQADQFRQVMAAQERIVEQLAAAVAILQETGDLQRNKLSDLRTEIEQMREFATDLKTLQRGVNSLPTTEPRAADRALGAGQRPVPHAAEPPESTAANASIHVRLLQRAAELQNERQGHWRRLLAFVTGR